MPCPRGLAQDTLLPQWRLLWAGGDPEAHVPHALPWTLGVLFQHLPGNLASQELREDS